MRNTAKSTSLVIHLGGEELVIGRRYEAASIANDVLIALWFIAGSVMFFSEQWTTTGTWCFLIGSIELLIRPAIRLTRHLHLQRVHSRAPELHSPAAPPDGSQDY
ncbi:YrhK family protein [Streptomyces coelicoflavus]|uniref:YrhK family protein n=1 Tax=Streptomyces coelicoflavus TaxID=285562 RepID=UPI003625361C